MGKNGLFSNDPGSSGYPYRDVLSRTQALTTGDNKLNYLKNSELLLIRWHHYPE
jgi:hypothetical protein